MKTTPTTLRNGFYAVTRGQIEDFSVCAMDSADNLRTILSAIARLATEETGEIKALAAMGKRIADELHNEIDVIQERAERSGLVGELVEERAEQAAGRCGMSANAKMPELFEIDDGHPFFTSINVYDGATELHRYASFLLEYVVKDEDENLELRAALHVLTAGTSKLRDTDRARV